MMRWPFRNTWLRVRRSIVTSSTFPGVKGTGRSNPFRKRPRRISAATMICAPPSDGSPSTFSGWTSTSLATRSASVPVVETKRCAVIEPESTTSSASGPVCQETTSGRSATKRWSATIQTGQAALDPLPSRFGAGTGRAWYGTGLAGSEIHDRTSSRILGGGGSKESRPPGPRYTLRSLPPRGGQAGSRCQTFDPVWKTSASGNGAPQRPFRWQAKNGAWTSSRKNFPVALPNPILPSLSPSASRQVRWAHGPWTRKFQPSASFRSIAS